MKKLFVSLLLTLFILVGCGGNSKTVDVTGWNTYDGETFSTVYPPEWSQNTLNAEGVNGILFADKNNGDSVNLIPVGRANNLEELLDSLKSQIDTVKSKYEQQGISYDYTSDFTDANIAGQKAKIITTKATLSAESIKNNTTTEGKNVIDSDVKVMYSQIYYVHKGETVYQITVASKTKENSKEIEGILENLKIK